MKLQVLQENLSEALNISSRFVSSRSQLPILANIKLEATKTKLNIQATNLETSFATSIGAKVETPGELAVPARIFSEVVGNLKSGGVNLAAQKEKLEITSEGFKGSVSGMNVSDFPAIPQSVVGESVTLPFSEVVHTLAKVLFSCSVDETRPILEGVLFVFGDKTLTFVSTDGFRLSQYTLQLAKKTTTNLERMVVPKLALSELARLSVGDADALKFQVKKKDAQVVVGINDMVLASRILEGKFPQFEDIIPAKSETVVRVDKQEFKRVIRLASTFARDNANIVKLEVGTKELIISAKSSKSGKQEGSIDAKVSGEKIIVAFNYKFIEDFLNVVTGEEIEVGFTDVASPGVFRDTSDSNYLHLIMPVKSQE